MDVTVHSELSREIFDLNNKLKPKVKDVLLEIAKKVLVELEEDIKISDIVLTGSMANYTYNEASDLDLHIVFDFSQINKDKRLVKKALDCNKYVWNMRHDIFLKNHEVELYYQDIDEPHAATGMYSLVKDEWIKIPTKPDLSKIDIDKNLIVKKIKSYISFIRMMKRELSKDLTNDYAAKLNHKAGRILEKLKQDRKDGLDEEGEFSENNIIFKYLRKNGYVDDLVDIVNVMYDKSFTEKYEYLRAIKKKRHTNATNSGLTRKKHPEFVPDIHRKDPTSFSKLEALKMSQKGRQVLSPSEFNTLRKRYNIDLILPGKFKSLGNTGIRVYFDTKLNRHVMEK